jgi:uncharacterized protein
MPPSLLTRGVAVMGRIPKPGAVKTRLTSVWTPEEAAELYEAFLRDVFALVDVAHAQLSFRRVFSCVVFEPDDLDRARHIVPKNWDVIEQGQGDLGQRIEFSRTACEADHVLVLGSDSPCMPPARIVRAFELLKNPATDFVMGPTDDGGYDLIGFQGLGDELLRDIPWSSDQVAERTRERANDLGYALAELDLGYDIDWPEDLERALRDAQVVEKRAIHTREAVLRLSAT